MGAEDGREDPAHPGTGAGARRSRWSTWSTPPARASPSRCRCSRAAAAPGGSSTTRSSSPGVVPQVCVLFGPSAAGGAYIPAFCDIVIMREGNASMYLGSPRMAEMVIGEKVTLEEMGGARMHTGVSGCGHQLVWSDEEGIELGPPLPLLPARQLARRATRRAGRRRPPRRRRPHRRADPRRREQAVRHQGADRGSPRRGLASSRSTRAGRRS